MLYLFDRFELDEENFCLLREGLRISVEPRALQVLLVLVSSQGRLLDKRTLLDAVWKDTFVEESTLTRAIAILRKHLEDDPRSPRFIETIPTRGYRFIASVEIADRIAVSPPGDRPSESSATSEASSSIPTDIDASLQTSPGTLPALTKEGQYRLYAYAAVVLTFLTLVGAVVGVRAVRFGRLKAGPTDPAIVLADFTNDSGDPVFDETLRQGMMVQLEQSPILRLANDSQIRKTLRLMGKSPDAPLTAEVSREVCQRVNGGVVLHGWMSRLGSAYVLGLRARSCNTGEVLDVEQIQFARKEDALDALSRIAAKFRARIGESILSIKDHDTPLAEATTPSLEALRAFSQAIKVFNTSGSGGAIPLLQHATELDPQFAVAYVWLGRMYADFGEETRSSENTRKAYELRDRASDRERFSIDVSYDLSVTGNLIKARETCEAWKQMYPRDTYPRAFLSGIIDPAFGQYEAALQEGRKTIEIDPDFVIGYRNMALNSIALNRLADAEAILQRAAKRKLFMQSFVTDSYRIAYLKGDTEGMKRAAKSAPSNPWLMNYDATTLSAQGHLAAARELSGRAVGLARQASRSDTEAQLELAAAFWEAFYGDPGIAKKRALTARKLSLGKNIEYGVAYVLALTKNSSDASNLISDLSARFPEDTIVQYDYVPTLQALLALNQNQPNKAIELIKTTIPYELSQPLHPIYIKGQALLATGHPVEAAHEFEKILGHPGLTLNDPLSVMARLQLGRAYALMGDKAKARTTYKTLLSSWNTADPDFHIQQQVKIELSKL